MRTCMIAEFRQERQRLLRFEADRMRRQYRANGTQYLDLSTAMHLTAIPISVFSRFISSYVVILTQTSTPLMSNASRSLFQTITTLPNPEGKRDSRAIPCPGIGRGRQR